MTFRHYDKGAHYMKAYCPDLVLKDVTDLKFCLTMLPHDLFFSYYIVFEKNSS